MNNPTTMDALRRAVAGATLGQNAVTAYALNAVLIALQSAGRPDFTVRDVQALHSILEIVDGLQKPSALDYAQARPVVAPRVSAAQATETTERSDG